MRTFIITILICLFSVSLFAQDISHVYKRAVNPGEISKVTYPGDGSIDVTYYKLDLNITYSPAYLSGVVKVNALSTQSNLQNFFLDLNNTMTVDSVKSGGQNLAFTHTSNKINITLNAPVNTGGDISVDVYYQGVPGSSGFGSFEFSDHNNTPAIWTLSEPYGSGDWWPCKDTPGDKADSSDVWVTADSLFVTVSNGTLEDVVNNGDGTKTYKWKNTYPIAQYLISLAMTNYAVYTNYFHYSDTDSMIVIHYNYPENLNNTRKANLDRTVSMLEVYSDKYGMYPFIDEKYGHAEFGWSGGMEHQTIASMGGFSESIISHELAHQWFGDKITCADWQNIWLNEGFATYSEAVYLEATYGKPAYDNDILLNMGDPSKWWTAKAAIGSIYVQDISSVNSIFNSARSYNKASVVLHMLRGIVGKDTFFNIMKTYASEPSVAYGVAVTEDFKRVAEQISGENLQYFFDEWIYGENYPKYSYGWGYSNVNGNIYEVNFQVSQDNNTTPAFFTMPIQLRITTAAGDTLITVFNDQQQQSFTFQVEGEPTQFEFDPGNWILKDINSVTGIDNDLTALKEYKLEQNYPNPFNPSTTIKFAVPVNSRVSINLYNMLGQKVSQILSQDFSAGVQQVNFNASNLSSGIYFYTLEANGVDGRNFTSTKKMMLMK